ncbi:MAG: hypothetical protein ACYTX0_46515, partial [Nostoc sp.]
TSQKQYLPAGKGLALSERAALCNQVIPLNTQLLQSLFLGEVIVFFGYSNLDYLEGSMEVKSMIFDRTLLVETLDNHGFAPTN